MSQIPITGSAIRVGDRVRVRRQPWLVTAVRQEGACAAVTVAGTCASNAGDERTFLTPFDIAESLTAIDRVRVASRSRWRRRCRALLAASGHADALRTAESARMDLLPYQLEPALAVVRGQASRVLIADEMGLGKTVQAALVIAELVARGAAARVLVLTPAGLRDQWSAELNDRFSLPLTILDLPTIRHERARWPLGVNPWTYHPFVVASLDYVKRPEVLPAIRDAQWDIVVVDEAHHATAGTDRLDAVAALCASSAYVLLLTATPHNGDAAAYDALCRLGRRDDDIVVFRRMRRELGDARPRRIHRIAVTLTGPERVMHGRLAAFIRAVRADHRGTDTSLAISVLSKRACSSAAALARTVRRRLAALDLDERVDTVRQMSLPFGDEGGEFDVADEAPVWTLPALDDRERERMLLTQLAVAAEHASMAEAKLSVLTRLLHRLREPAIVFTEYRDTLLHVQRVVAPDAPVIHGGLTRHERLAALRAFDSSRVLLATDAAGEGLNLHHRCRVVINLELPWNPMRLEQRIGRVDRIGQTRRVHAFHLIAAAAGERRVLRRLTARATAAREAVGGVDPLGLEPRATRASSGDVASPRLGLEARTEHRRLQRARTLQRHASGPLDDTGDILVTRARTREMRRQLAGRVLLLDRTDAVDVTGRIVASHVTYRFLAAPWNPPVSIEAITRVMSGRDPDVSPLASWTEIVQDVHHALWTTHTLRQLAIGADLERWSGTPIQSGLFDQRSLRAHERAASDHAERSMRQAQRIDAARRGQQLTFLLPRLVLVLLP